MKTHLGLWFIDCDGSDVASYQMLGGDGRAYAVADFYDGRLERFIYAPSVREGAERFLKIVTKFEESGEMYHEFTPTKIELT